MTLCDGASPGEAVSSSQDPLVVDEGASTEMAARMQTHLPGPRSCRGVLSSHDLRVERCDATNWKDRVKGQVTTAAVCVCVFTVSVSGRFSLRVFIN